MQSKEMKSNKFMSFFYNQSMLLIFILFFVFMSIFSSSFLTLINLSNIIKQSAVIGIMACGMTIVIIGKGLDLSAAAILGLCSVINVMLQPYGYLTAIIISVIVGTVCGFINGYLIGKIKANYIIITLGTQLLFTALSLIISEGRNLKNRTEPIFSYIGTQNLFGVPVILYLLIIIFSIFSLFLHKSIPGRRLFIVGSNDKAARVAGINVDNIIASSYIINGFICGVASIVLASRLPRIRVGTAASYLFDVITVVVLGGTALSGGIGGMYNTVIGLGIFALLNNGMALLGISYEYQQVIKGIVLILAVLYNEFNRRKRLLY